MQYYLGANTAQGFYSLYDEFCPPQSGAFLWLLKGGPGCGKSSFMRRIGSAMQSIGFAVDYVLCSADPDSVDGVYIPALRTGYVDATAPHVQEAFLPGAAQLYLDLGQFYDRVSLQAQRQPLYELLLRYKALYREAYRLLGQCRAPQFTASDAPLPEISPRSERPGQMQRRFLRAVSCKGLVSVPVEPRRHMQQVESPAALSRLAACVVSAGHDVVCVQHPVFPQLCEAVLPDSADTAYFVAPELLDAPFLPKLDEICAVLCQAKQLHDELEARYNPHVRFDGVYALAQEHIEALKKQNADRENSAL